MSQTYSEFITDALIELGRLGEGQTASAYQGKTGLNALNSMMEELKANDMDFHWHEAKLANIGETVPVPEWAREGLISMLAVKLSPKMRAPVTREVRDKAIAGKKTIGARLINQQLTNADMSHMPRGTGHLQGQAYDITTDS